MLNCEWTALAPSAGRAEDRATHSKLQHAQFLVKKSKRVDLYALLGVKGRERANVREIRAGYKRAALQCLKKKKLYEQQIEQLQNQQLKLEEQVITLEGSKTIAETFTALKSGAGAMKQLHKETNIDEVDKVRPDLSYKESNPKDPTVNLSPLTPLPPPPNRVP